MLNLDFLPNFPSCLDPTDLATWYVHGCEAQPPPLERRAVVGNRNTDGKLAPPPACLHALPLGGEATRHNHLSAPIARAHVRSPAPLLLPCPGPGMPGPPPPPAVMTNHHTLPPPAVMTDHHTPPPPATMTDHRTTPPPAKTTNRPITPPRATPTNHRAQPSLPTTRDDHLPLLLTGPAE